MAAFVLGNGLSRQHIDVNRLLELGAVYACNAIYRTHVPTVLVATDANIAREIQETGYSKSHAFYTRRPLANLGARVIPKSYFGFSSGPVATALAAQDKCTPIYLVGFDMGPDPKGKFNNIYADTQHYKQSGAPPTYTGNWIKQIIKIVNDYSGTDFYRVSGETTAVIEEFRHVRNLKDMPMSEFMQSINTGKGI